MYMEEGKITVQISEKVIKIHTSIYSKQHKNIIHKYMNVPYILLEIFSSVLKRSL